MTVLDYLLCGAYLAMVLVVGGWARWTMRVRGEQGSAVGYFLAGRSVGWMPLGLSIMISVFSAVNFGAFSGEVAKHGLAVLVSIPVFVLVAWPVARYIIPLVRSLPAVNAYDYFEYRFDPRVRRLATAVFLLWRIMWMATALWACGVITSGITGWPIAAIILTAGGAAILYTTIGGLRGVFWTDAAQFVVLLTSMIIAVAVVATRQGGLLAMLAASHAGDRFTPISPVDMSFFSVDPRIRITLFSGLVGTLVMFLARYGADQMILQRYMAARSDRDAARGLWLNVAAMLVALTLLALLGLAAFVHAHEAGRGDLPGLAQVTLLLRSLPAGLLGLVVAAVLAAAMSSLDSALNACASTWTRQLNLSAWGNPRVLTATLGCVVIALSFAVGQLGTLFEVASRIINGLGSPLLALMLLALFSRRANGHGVFWGGLLGTLASITISFGVQGLSLHLYAVVNFLITLLLAYALSLSAPQPMRHNTAEQLRWTWAGWRN